MAERNFAAVDSLFFPSLLAFSEEAILGFQQQVGDNCFPQAVESTYLLFQKTGNKKWLDKAFRYSERMKSMLMYRDMLNRHANTDASYFIWADSARKLVAKINRLQFLHENQRNWSTASQRELENAITSLEQVNLNRRKTSNEYYATIYQPIPTIQEVQATLAEKEVLIEYCFGKEHLYALCISKKGEIGFSKLADADALKARLKRFHLNVQRYGDSIIAITDTLSSELLQPFAHIMEGNLELLIIPDRELYLLPFEALNWEIKRTGKPQNPTECTFVVDDFAVAYSPSWKVHLAHREDARGVFLPKSIGIWADVSLGNQKITTNAIFETFGKTIRVDTFSGNNCTKTSFLREQSRYDVLHLFMHGKSNLADRHDNKLSFGHPNDTLWGFEVQEHTFSARLVVLSACETALGRNESGEGSFTLSRSFLQAGVPQVVATLWEVQEEKTAGILADFYRGLGQGIPTTKALQDAKKTYRRNAQGFWKHPAFWAGAVVME